MRRCAGADADACTDARPGWRRRTQTTSARSALIAMLRGALTWATAHAADRGDVSAWFFDPPARHADNLTALQKRAEAGNSSAQR